MGGCCTKAESKDPDNYDEIGFENGGNIEMDEPTPAATPEVVPPATVPPPDKETSRDEPRSPASLDDEDESSNLESSPPRVTVIPKTVARRPVVAKPKPTGEALLPSDDDRCIADIKSALAATEAKRREERIRFENSIATPYDKAILRTKLFPDDQGQFGKALPAYQRNSRERSHYIEQHPKRRRKRRKAAKVPRVRDTTSTPYEDWGVVTPYYEWDVSSTKSDTTGFVKMQDREAFNEMIKRKRGHRKRHPKREVRGVDGQLPSNPSPSNRTEVRIRRMLIYLDRLRKRKIRIGEELEEVGSQDQEVQFELLEVLRIEAKIKAKLNALNKLQTDTGGPKDAPKDAEQRPDQPKGGHASTRTTKKKRHANGSTSLSSSFSSSMKRKRKKNTGTPRGDS